MICSRHPQNIVSKKAPVPAHDILNHIIQGMTHVQYASDIWRRYNNGKSFFITFIFCLEKSVIKPVFIPFFFNTLWLIPFVQRIRTHIFTPQTHINEKGDYLINPQNLLHKLFYLNSGISDFIKIFLQTSFKIYNLFFNYSFHDFKKNFFNFFCKFLFNHPLKGGINLFLTDGGITHQH